MLSSIPLRLFNEAERPLPAELHCATGADTDCDIEDAWDIFDCEGQVEVQARGPDARDTSPTTTPVAPELIQRLLSINSDGYLCRCYRSRNRFRFQARDTGSTGNREIRRLVPRLLQDVIGGALGQLWRPTRGAVPGAAKRAHSNAPIDESISGCQALRVDIAQIH